MFENPTVSFSCLFAIATNTGQAGCVVGGKGMVVQTWPRSTGPWLLTGWPSTPRKDAFCGGDGIRSWGMRVTLAPAAVLGPSSMEVIVVVIVVEEGVVVLVMSRV